MWTRGLRLLPYILSRPNRARALGARVEVCAFLTAVNPQPSLLLVKSRYGPWMPLQEGVGIDETLDAAFWRGLSEEVGIEVELSERGRLVNDQGQQFLGTRRLPADRHDRALRPVAPGLQDGHPLTMVKMRKKAYWALFRQVADSSRFVLTPNGTEVVDAEWVSLDEARNRITRSVPDDKRALLLKGVDTCARTFSGTALHIPDY